MGKQDLKITEIDDGVLLHIKVQSGASSDRIGEVWNGLLKVYITKAPEKGAANKAVIRLLSKRFNIPKSSISIVKGERERNKVVALHKISKSSVIERLSRD